MINMLGDIGFAMVAASVFWLQVRRAKEDKKVEQSNGTHRKNLAWVFVPPLMLQYAGTVLQVVHRLMTGRSAMILLTALVGETILFTDVVWRTGQTQKKGPNAPDDHDIMDEQ